ncbi:MAG: 16S rRNA (uracil(1498)-N(3))-methyltransferase [bacterium]
MRLTRIYTNQALSENSEMSLDQAATRHLINVLRLPNGAALTVFNGHGGEYSATLSGVDGKRAHIRIEAFDPVDRESPLSVHLGIGISRGERMDWVIQKATELGVSRITPLFTERTEVKLKPDREDKKLSHWRQISISACEQCGRNRIPVIDPPQKLANWLSVEADLKLVLHHRSEKSISELQPLKPTSVCLLIGSEGGLSADEIAAATDSDFMPLTLGPRIMRTETAPLATISILQSIWGDMGVLQAH